MRETIDFRVNEDYAKKYLPPGTGDRIGATVRRVIAEPGDPLFSTIERLSRQFQKKGKFFFTGFVHRRSYTRKELEAAELLYAYPKRYFEPSGDECGTVYDDAGACPECGVGVIQRSPLILKVGRIPKTFDFASTFGSELVVSSKAKDVLEEQRISGVSFGPVEARAGAACDTHHQLFLTGAMVDIDPATKVGSDPFDDTSHGRCSRGHVAGLNLLSEVTVRRSTAKTTDVMVTRQMVGVRRGVLRPFPLMLLSPRAWRVIEAAGLKGLAIEVARYSDQQSAAGGR